MKPLSAKDRRALFIGALVLAPFLAYLWVWRPYHNAMRDTRDRLSIEREALARELGAVATAQRYPQLQHVTDSVLGTFEPRLFEGHDDVMATSELASYLGDVAFESRVWLQDAATRPATNGASGVRTLHVEIRGESDFRGILRFIQALERGDKFTRIERMDISRTLGGPGNEKAETLAISATISGYAMGTGSGSATPVPRRNSPSAATGGQ